MRNFRIAPPSGFPAGFHYGHGQDRRMLLRRLRRAASRGTVVLTDASTERRSLTPIPGTAADVAAELGHLSEEVFPAWELLELRASGRGQPRPETIDAMRRRIDIYHLRNVQIPDVATIDLELASRNCLPIISAELWRSDVAMVGGFIIFPTFQARARFRPLVFEILGVEK